MDIDALRRRMFEEEQRYAKLTRHHFEELNDEQLIQAILANIRTRIGKRYEDAERIVIELSNGLQMVHTLYWLNSEVRNGGFRQYFYNPAGVLAVHAAMSFKLISATRHYEVVNKAISAFVGIEPFSAKEFIRRINNMPEWEELKYLNAFNSEYYDCGSFDKLQIDYVRNNVSEFV